MAETEQSRNILLTLHKCEAERKTTLTQLRGFSRFQQNWTHPAGTNAIVTRPYLSAAVLHAAAIFYQIRLKAPNSRRLLQEYKAEALRLRVYSREEGQ